MVVDPEIDAAMAEMNTCLEEFIRRKKDQDDVNNKLNGVSREYRQIKKEKQELKRKLGIAGEKLHESMERVTLVLVAERDAGSTDGGGSKQVAGNVNNRRNR